MMKNLKQRVAMWLVPGVLAEVSRMKFFTEAVHDLHMVPVPYNEVTVEVAFQNAIHFEREVMERDGHLGPDFIRDRQTSLFEICQRSKLL